MRHFEKALNAALIENDDNLLPEREKIGIKVQKQLGIKKLSEKEKDEVGEQYYGSDD
jgi:hypothetical protein